MATEKISVKKTLSYYWQQSRKHKALFWAVMWSYGIAALLDSMVIPNMYRKIIDAITTTSVAAGGADIALKAILVFFSIAVLTLLINRILYAIGDFTIVSFQSKVMRDLSVFSFKKITSHSYQFFANSFSGSLLKKAGRFVYSFEDIHDTFIYNLLFPILKLCGIFAVMFFVKPFLGTIFFVWTVIFVCISSYLSRKQSQLDLVEANYDSKVTARKADVLTNILNLKLFTSGHREAKEYEDITTVHMHKRLFAKNYANFIYLIQGLLVTWLEIIVLYAAIMLWHDGLITVGTVAIVQGYLITTVDSVWSLGKQLSRLSKSFSNAQEMVDIFELPVEIVDPKQPEVSNIHAGNLELKNVLFKYENGRDILSDFSLSIKAGERVGIVGSSGAGKSTLTKILLRFADVTSGSVEIDGQDIRNLKQDDVRKSISYVPQDSILFHRSLAENIAYGKPEATQKEIEEAAMRAFAHEFITSLPHGYDTLVGERGVKLSGGERQRVAIARAILKNAPILILDEATSSLDSQSEEYIQKAFDELMKQKTVIVIAHRLSTIQKMDRIIVMEKGQIIEDGSHKKLIAKKGRYYELWNKQAGGFIKE